MKRRKLGFTLIELIAVIIVLAIILILTIPALLDTTQKAKKESFYLYAQSLYSKSLAKYTDDQDVSAEKGSCSVYDVSKDLGLSNTGNYEGWVRVKREPVTNGKKTLYVTVNAGKKIQNVKYCITTGNSCTPNKSYYFQEGLTNLVVSQVVEENQNMCVNYQYGDNDKLVTSKASCMKYSEGEDHVGSYKYEVTLSLKDNQYAVENYLLNEDLSRDEFYKTMDNFSKTNGNLVIHKPSCDGSSDTKGEEDTPGITKITSSTSTKQGTTNVSSSTTTTRNTINVSTTPTTTRGEIYVTTPSTTTTSNIVIGTTTTTTQTTQIPTTTVDPSHIELLLNNLEVSGHNINFSPVKFYYEITVPYSVRSLKVTAATTTPTTTYVIYGNENFLVGTNQIRIELLDTLTARKSNYYIVVNRQANPNPDPSTTTRPTTTIKVEEGKPDPELPASDASLKSLRIEGYSFSFDPAVYEYDIETKGESELSVKYEANNRNALVDVNGTKSIVDGGQIVILVQSENGYYMKIYTINIHFQEKKKSSAWIYRGITIMLLIILFIVLVVVAVKNNKKLTYDDIK